MSTAKEEVHALLTKLPDDCSLEDIVFHLYVIEKVRNGLKLPIRRAQFLKKKSSSGLANGSPSSMVTARD